jgi:hypothetical protein
VVERLALAVFVPNLFSMVDVSWLLGQLAFAFTFYKVIQAVFHVSAIETPSDIFSFG